MRGAARAFAGAFLAATLATGAAWSDDDVRPTVLMNRWQEDWSVLADPALRTEPYDGIKYIPLSATDPMTYLSLGLTLRERFEANDAASFGIGPTKSGSYFLQRVQVHADLRIDQAWQLFTQFEDARAFDKHPTTPVDENPLDLRLAFLAYTHAFDGGTLKARIGRQDFAFDLQRFVSSRDGPNVRQSFDAAWIDWETGLWRFIGFVSQPVQYADERPFDDTSNGHFRFSTLRVERLIDGKDELSAYYSLYERDNARYLDGAGTERRDIFDTRFAGTAAGFDWDLEAMGQTGSVGAKDIRAWAVGARSGYSFAETPWRPRFGLQADMASGDDHPGDGTVGTFNPLFPNGYYFTLAGYTGSANLVHIKPSLTIRPADKLSLMAGIGLQWRMTTADAIYVQPNVPLHGTAGTGHGWTGAYAQLRADYAIRADLAGAVEAVHYQIGDTIRRAGGHDSDYLGIELKLSI